MATKTKTRRVKLAEIAAMQAPEGREIMVIGPMIWGKGKTGEEALRKCLSLGARRARGTPVMVFEVAAGAYVNDHGYICYESGERSQEKLRGVIA